MDPKYLHTGTVITSGIVANGIAVQGPDPFYPRANLENRVVVIAGGNTGLGLESAKRLAAAVATIILTSRSEKNGREAVEAVLDYSDKKIQTSSLCLWIYATLRVFEIFRKN